MTNVAAYNMDSRLAYKIKSYIINPPYPGVYVIKHFSLSMTFRQNKLEDFYIVNILYG